MNIGEATRQTGLPAKTIRYYEDIDLLHPARAENGYRDYDSRDIHVLRFLQRSRGLGFSIQDCRTLLTLYQDRGRASADVKEIAKKRIADIDQKMTELSGMRTMLINLADNCHGDDRPDCPILDDLAGGGESM